LKIIKGAIRSHNSKKKAGNTIAIEKRSNNDLQIAMQKTKDSATRKSH
jgi:hypothetical protein